MMKNQFEVIDLRYLIQLQSDVPQEVGQVAKAVIKEAVTSDFLASPDLVPRYGYDLSQT